MVTRNYRIQNESVISESKRSLADKICVWNPGFKEKRSNEYCGLTREVMNIVEE